MGIFSITAKEALAQKKKKMERKKHEREVALKMAEAEQKENERVMAEAAINQDKLDKKRALRSHRQRFHEKQIERDNFKMSPAGQAKAAKAAGMKIFQIDIELNKTSGFVVPMMGAYTAVSETKNQSNIIQSVEEQGWHLEHIGYVYRTTGVTSRDKFLASGQQEAISGETIGIYLFRAT